LPYKRSFWSNAPRSLREHANRFRISHRAPTELPQTQPQVSGIAAVPHILVVDDEEPMRSVVACYAERLGYKVTTAADGAEALALLLRSRFDVVITDALMPKMDGRELCRLIRQSKAPIKTVLLTSLYKSTRFKSEAHHRFGVDEYLTKPLLFNELEALLRRIAPHDTEGVEPARTPSAIRTQCEI